MAATTPLQVGKTAEVRTPMAAFLLGQHARWRQEVWDVLDPARQDDAGVWMRWQAIQYLTTGFTRRFQRERRAVASLHGHLTGAQASHLWAAGELITQLLGRHDTGLCHRVSEFGSLALNLLNAVDYWCQQVEEALGPVRWGEVPTESRHLLEVISFDELGP